MDSAQTVNQSTEQTADDPSAVLRQQQQQQPSELQVQTEPVGEQNGQQNVSDTVADVQSISSPGQASPSTRVVPGTEPVRVPGTYPPEWLPDHETNNCMSCDSLFTLIKRRHHCRSCGKIFCADCCRHKAKLLYLDNKEARVCRNCRTLIENTLYDSPIRNRPHEPSENHQPTPSSSGSAGRQPSSETKVQGVLKTINRLRSQNNECNTSTSSSTDQQLNKQVIFADGIRPGTDLSEPFPYPMSASGTTAGPSSATFSLLTRQSRQPEGQGTSKKSRSTKGNEFQNRNITVCDELGYLPPIVISNDAPIVNDSDFSNSTSNSLTSYIINQFKSTGAKKTIQASMESRSCPLNGIIRFEDISGLVGVDQIVTFLLLRDYYLRVKLINKQCCMSSEISEPKSNNESEPVDNGISPSNEPVQYWCFASDGLARFGQSEIVLVIDKDSDDPCIPRDVFKIYLTLHELALRRQSLENLGNLLFQDGLFDSRGTAGLLFVRPMPDHCLQNMIIPDKNFLVALVLQRWEVPWSKVFPVRLLLRLGHKFKQYPYPLISYRVRDPVYYEVGHTIISILGDFRNFRYGINHVDGLKVMLNKATKRVMVLLDKASYQQFNKVLDSSNNEHVLAWSSYPFMEAQGHLVSVQNEEGNYETVEFYKKTNDPSVSFNSLESDEHILGASFIIFSGALKVDQSGQSAKISVVEDGLLIQIQSCTMSALKNAIHYMHHFDIDCGKCTTTYFSMQSVQQATNNYPNPIYEHRKRKRPFQQGRDTMAGRSVNV